MGRGRPGVDQDASIHRGPQWLAAGARDGLAWVPLCPLSAPRRPPHHVMQLLGVWNVFQFYFFLYYFQR